MRFREQVVVINGVGRGVGMELAERFAAEGATVVLADSDNVGGAVVAQRLHLQFVSLDVQNANAVAQAVDEIVTQHGRIDVWVNCGRPVHNGMAIDLNPAGWDVDINAMLSGTFYCAQQVGKMMIRQGRGAMVNLASVNGLLAQQGQAAACVANSGLLMLTQTLASEWGAYGVRVNAVALGIIKGETGSHEQVQGLLSEQRYLSRIPLGRLGKTSEVVEAVTFLASDEASFMTGSVLRVDGGWGAYHLFYPFETAFETANE